MNYRVVCNILGKVLLAEAILLLLPMTAALWYHESVLPFLWTMLPLALLGGGLNFVKPKSNSLFAREGFVVVGLSWVLMSAFGALPFVLSGDIPHYIDALFETVSGFTTTGSSILTDVEAMSRGCMFWRLFTHWVGGMGVLVFIAAILPVSGDHYIHVMRAEVPGPTVSKLVPKARKTARILYLIYLGLTLLEAIFLLCGGMSFYDAILHAFATAGTGGFSTQGASIAAYDSVYIEMVILQPLLSDSAGAGQGDLQERGASCLSHGDRGGGADHRAEHHEQRRKLCPRSALRLFSSHDHYKHHRLRNSGL